MQTTVTTRCRPEVLRSTPRSAPRCARYARPALLSPAQEEALLDATLAIFDGGRDVEDIRAGKKAPQSMALRPAWRAYQLRRPKARVVAFYASLLAAVMAAYPDDEVAPEQLPTVMEASIGEERAEAGLDELQVQLGPTPTIAQLLEADRRAVAQLEATSRFRDAVQRELARRDQGGLAGRGARRMVMV